jgi:putative flippase GtrA
MYLAIKYALFAALATAVNILVQDLALHLPAAVHPLALPMAPGTLAGLVTKYVLDKRYIFRFTTRNAAEDTRKFALYSAMGLVTTAVFWGTEIGFELLFRTKAMRYTGAVIGLAVGYWIKYALDKRFVFRRAS